MTKCIHHGYKCFTFLYLPLVSLLASGAKCYYRGHLHQETYTYHHHPLQQNCLQNPKFSLVILTAIIQRWQEPSAGERYMRGPHYRRVDPPQVMMRVLEYRVSGGSQPPPTPRTQVDNTTAGLL